MPRRQPRRSRVPQGSRATLQIPRATREHLPQPGAQRPPAGLPRSESPGKDVNRLGGGPAAGPEAGFALGFSRPSSERRAEGRRGAALPCPPSSARARAEGAEARPGSPGSRRQRTCHGCRLPLSRQLAPLRGVGWNQGSCETRGGGAGPRGVEIAERTCRTLVLPDSLSEWEMSPSRCGFTQILTPDYVQPEPCPGPRG